MRRGDIVIVSASGDYGKPRPALVVQSDWVGGTDSVLVSLFTSTLRDAPIFRVTVSPSSENGLRVISQIMVDKVLALPREKCGAVIGHLDDDVIAAFNQRLAVILGLVD